MSKAPFNKSKLSMDGRNELILHDVPEIEWCLMAVIPNHKDVNGVIKNIPINPQGMTIHMLGVIADKIKEGACAGMLKPVKEESQTRH